MKNDILKKRRTKIIAAVCAMTVLAGGTARIYAFSSSDPDKSEQTEEAGEQETSSDKDSGIISAGGTVTSSQLSDELGLKNTSVKLTVEEVLAESGDSVSEGTQIYKLTDDSVEKAKKTLQSELTSAKNALTEQKTTAKADKIKAKTLYESELLLGDTAQTEYESGLTALDTALQKAYDDYEEAQDTVNNTPTDISKKQSEANKLRSEVTSLQSSIKTAQKKNDKYEKAYTEAAESYNSLLTDYNSSASVVKYLGNALGNDTSDISLAQETSADIKQQSTDTTSNDNTESGDTPSFDGTDFGSFDPSQISSGQMPSGSDMQFEAKTPSAGTKTADTKEKAAPQQSAAAAQKTTQQTTSSTEKNTGSKKASKQSTASSGSSEIKALYDQAYKEYTEQKKKLDKAEETLDKAEKQYRSAASELDELNGKLKETQNSITSLEKEISSLETSLSKAKSNLSKLLSEYNSLKASYETDKLELKNKLDTDLASYENAKFHYELTCNTIDEELAQKQLDHDTAKENLSIFESELADGYIKAGQDGTVYSLSTKAGRNIDVTSPFVYYVDQDDLSITVELDQYDVTEIAIGDSVIIYSSETGMTNGRITAIAAGESTSLVDVRFNVTVEADNGSKLYDGQSVNVYFNYTGSMSGSLKDFGGKSDGGSKGLDPGSFGDMPEGFDVSDLPDDIDFSDMPSFGGRKGE